MCSGPSSALAFRARMGLHCCVPTLGQIPMSDVHKTALAIGGRGESGQARSPHDGAQPTPGWRVTTTGAIGAILPNGKGNGPLPSALKEPLLPRCTGFPQEQVPSHPAGCKRPQGCEPPRLRLREADHLAAPGCSLHSLQEHVFHVYYVITVKLMSVSNKALQDSSTVTTLPV